MSDIPPLPFPLITALANRTGLSHTYVSQAINAPNTLEEDIYQKILTAAQELRYIPSPTHGKDVQPCRPYTLGLLLPNASDEFFAPLVYGVENGAQQREFNLLVSTQDGTAFNQLSHRGINENTTAGMIIYSNGVREEDLRRLHALGQPMVLMYSLPPAGLDIPSIMINNKSGSTQMMDHLIKVHHYTRIALLRGDETQIDAQQRYEGYCESLKTHGIPFDPDLVAIGNFDQTQADTATQKLMTRHPDIEAIFAADDTMAIGALNALQRMGKRVPIDVAVVGFDDIMVAGYVTPPLTTVRVEIKSVGYAAVNQLIQLISAGRTDPVTRIPVRLTLRRSCGCY